MTTSDQNNPGRSRVFELMRQRDAAIETSGDVKKMPTRQVAPADLEQIQETALRSFGIKPAGRSGLP